MNSKVYQVLLTILIAIFAAPTIFAQGESNSIKEVDFTARTINGKRVQLKKLLENGPVVLDFWALWCVPCLKEMPHLQKILNDYQDQGLTVVAINQDSPSDHAKVKPYVRQKRFDFVVIIDEDKDLWDQFNITALPTTIVIDQSGNITYAHTGYKTGDEKELRSQIEALFATGSSTD